LKAETPTKFGPTIIYHIIYDVDKSSPKEEITEQIILKNLEDPNIDKKTLRDKIKFKFNIKTRSASKINWIVKLPLVIYKALIKRER